MTREFDIWFSVIRHVIVNIPWIHDIARVEIKKTDVLSFFLYNRIGLGKANFTCHKK